MMKISKPAAGTWNKQQMMNISKPAVGWNLEQTANDEDFYNKQQTMKISKPVVGWNLEQTANDEFRDTDAIA